MKYLTLCLLTSKAMIPEEVINYPASGLTKESASNALTASDTFANCPCDLTAGGCDEACCCDLDCSASIRKLWQSEGGICSKQDIQRLNLGSCLKEVTDK